MDSLRMLGLPLLTVTALSAPAAPAGAGDLASEINGLPTYGSFNDMAAATDAPVPPVEAVTTGPKFHWFGYYLHAELDASGRYLLAGEVGFEHRLPEPQDAIKVGVIDLQDGNRWIEFGESRAWSWQQGCFVQWRPGHEWEIVWNDREGDRPVCRVMDFRTREIRTLPMAIDEAISPDGKWALCSDFSRIWRVRPGYGYPGVETPSTAADVPDDVGIWRMNMETGETKLLASLADLLKLPFNKGLDPGKYHYVNHIQWSPDGKRFSVFHRWQDRGQPTRVYTMTGDGGDVRLLSASGASHWTWRDPEHVLIWTVGHDYALFRDNNSGEPVATLWQAPNGHQSYIPGTSDEWLVTDTYPRGKAREQLLHLVHLPTKRFILLGRFRLPPEYRGEWRCDLHARVTPDGTRVYFDSPHGGNGRQIYGIDIGAIVGTVTAGAGVRGKE